MSDQKNTFYKVGEHYRIETSTFTLLGVQLTGLDDSGNILEFAPFKLVKNAADLGFANYHDGTKRKLDAKFSISREQIQYASLWDLGF